MILTECEGETTQACAIDYDMYLHQGTRRDELMLTILVPPWSDWQSAIADLAPRPGISDILQRMVSNHPPYHEEVLGNCLSTGRILLGRFQAAWYQSCSTSQLSVDNLGLARVGDVPSPLLNLSGTEDF